MFILQCSGPPPGVQQDWIGFGATSLVEPSVSKPLKMGSRTLAVEQKKLAGIMWEGSK